MIPIKLGLPVKYAVSNLENSPDSPWTELSDLEGVKQGEGCESRNVVLWDKAGSVQDYSYEMSS